MGVMGWTPETVSQACLRDLHDAWIGWMEYRGISPASPITREFMNEMVKKFPDERKQE